MDVSLKPDEEIVFREFSRLDVEPNQIPVELFAGFLERLASSCNISLPRARIALQGLIDTGIFDSTLEEKEERIHEEREIIRDLLLHDPEIRGLLKTMVAEFCPDRK